MSSAIYLYYGLYEFIMYGNRPIGGTLLNYGNRLARGLVGAYLFDEETGERVHDSSGTNINLDAFEGFTWTRTDAKYGWDGRFLEGAGNDTYLKSDRNIGGTDLSPSYVTVIARFAPGTGDSIIVSAWRLGDANNQSFMLWNDDPVSEFIVRDSGGTASTANGSNFTSLEFITLAGTYDGKTAKIYEDGVLAGSGTGATGSLRSAGAYPLYVATNEGNAGTSTDHFSGWVSYIYIYNRALTADEVMELYLAPFSMFDERPSRIVYDEIAAGITSKPYYYREIASRRIA